MADSHGTSRPPVVVIGMHRSGTTLTARVLDRHGLFVGARQAAQHESSYFNKQNRWLLASAGGRWDTPCAIDHLLADTAGKHLAVEYLRLQQASPRAVEFLGLARYLRLRRIDRLAEPWGWKDPRTTVTLPLWLEVFPGARVLHVVRNGVDVAESLYRRQLAGQSQAESRWNRLRPIYHLRSKKGWFGTSPRLTRRIEGFRLWEEYLGFAERHTSGLGDRVKTVRFEDMLARPSDILPQILEFCRLPARRQEVERTIATLRPERSEAFRGQETLIDMWEQVRSSAWMRTFGYDQHPGEDR